jgi:hypothetical protein
MGDGRYYTYYQFYSIIILVVLGIFILGSMVIGYYRNKEKEIKYYALTTFTLTILNVVLRIIESVIPSIKVAFVLRCIQLTVLIVVIGILYNRFFVKMLKGNKYLYVRLSCLTKIFTLVLVISVLISKGNSLIKEYQFFCVEYTVLYKGTIIIFLIIAIVEMIKITVGKKHIHNIFKKRNSVVIIMGLLITPLGLYTLFMISQNNYLDFVEYFIYLAIGLMINLTIYSESELGVTAITFDKIGDMIHDFIFVTDINGKLIYKNESALKADFFTTKEVINLECLMDLYEGNVYPQKSYLGKVYMKVMNQHQEYCLIHKRKELRDGHKVIGHIITVTDITALIGLLSDLEEKKEKLEDVNQKLNRYAKEVYYLEKEKEINILLEEIIYSREKDMKALILMIEKIERNSDEHNFEQFVDEAIINSQKILNDVRKTVSENRQYFGG